MFKELFQTSNLTKDKGIAGITSVSVNVTPGQDKTLNKQKSKNKFQSSSATYDHSRDDEPYEIEDSFTNDNKENIQKRLAEDIINQHLQEEEKGLKKLST
jgi:hypothetical protein